MKKYQKTIIVYELDGGFFVEVSEGKDSIDVHLYHEDYGIKAYMFGLSNGGGDFAKGLMLALDSMIISNVGKHIENYKKNFFDAEENN